MVIGLERGADLHMAQLMSLPLTVSCFSKNQIGFTFLVPAHLGSPRQRAFKCVCVLVCSNWTCKCLQWLTILETDVIISSYIYDTAAVTTYLSVFVVCCYKHTKESGTIVWHGSEVWNCVQFINTVHVVFGRFCSMVSIHLSVWSIDSCVLLLWVCCCGPGTHTHTLV